MGSSPSKETRGALDSYGLKYVETKSARGNAYSAYRVADPHGNICEITVKGSTRQWIVDLWVGTPETGDLVVDDYANTTVTDAAWIANNWRSGSMRSVLSA